MHVSASMPKRVRTTRLPSLSCLAICGRMRRCRASWHSPSAMITFRPRCGVVLASTIALRMRVDAVGANRLEPLDADALQNGVDARRLALAPGHSCGRRNSLAAGRRRIAVLHDDQDAVAAVGERARHTGRQPVVPEAAVAHDADHAALEIGGDAAAAGQAQPVAQHGIADIEGRQRREDVTADVRRSYASCRSPSRRS